MTTADEERAAVVAWLRLRINEVTWQRLDAESGGNWDAFRSLGGAVDELKCAVRLIERGDHRAPATGKERGE